MQPITYIDIFVVYIMIDTKLKLLIIKLDFMFSTLQKILDNLINNYQENYIPIKNKYNTICKNNKYLIEKFDILQTYCKKIDDLIILGDLIYNDINLCV
jgi:hypothetical protein